MKIPVRIELSTPEYIYSFNCARLPHKPLELVVNNIVGEKNGEQSDLFVQYIAGKMAILSNNGGTSEFVDSAEIYKFHPSRRAASRSQNHL